MAVQIARSAIEQVVARIADMIVPPVCLACHARLDRQDSLCGTCWQGVAFIRAPLCERLGIPLPFGPADRGLVSAAAAADPPAWGRARAVAVYESGSVIAGLIHGMKYADRHDARRMLGKWLVEAGRELLADGDCLVPVPLTRRRLIQRQFNQSGLLAREVSRLSGVQWHSLVLTKVRETEPQVSLSGVARRENVRGAFAVPPHRRGAIEGRKVILIDDVITTGATAEAATKALLAAGAATVDVLAVARVTTPDVASP